MPLVSSIKFFLCGCPDYYSTLTADGLLHAADTASRLALPQGLTILPPSGRIATQRNFADRYLSILGETVIE